MHKFSEILKQPEGPKLEFKETLPTKTESLHWQEIVNQGESSEHKFKSTLRVKLITGKPEKIIDHTVLKILEAFLNSEGGTLLIGVSDTKEILDLETDFSSFPKPDKLDEFQKHFDNLIARSLGNNSHHCLKVDFPEIEGKTVCALTINGKSAESSYITGENGKEYFNVRRLASTEELKPSEIAKYINEHWKNSL